MKRIIYIIIGMVCCLSVQAQTVSEQLKSATNLTVFNRLVEACGLQDELSKVEDETYAELYRAGAINDLPPLPTENQPGYVPEHRYYGYTVFPETDAFWQQTLGKQPANISVTDVENYVKARGQSLNEFVTYHILPVKLAKDKLVIHYNEKGYNYQNSTMDYTIPTYEIYTTLDGRRLLKLYQCGPRYSLDGNSDVWLNRTPVLDDWMNGNLREVSITPETTGIRVDTAQVVTGENGYIYPLSSLLIYDNNVRQQVLGGRLRYDVASLFPEFMNNDIRGDRTGSDRTLRVGLPLNNVYQYSDGLHIKEGLFYYLSGFRMAWNNWQGDEFNVVGQCDFTLRLPPVPADGEYELRLAVQVGSRYRGIVQYYIGSDKDNLVPVGLPMDMREGGEYRYTSAGNFPSRFRWEADIVADSEYNRLVDLRLYEAGVLKAPASYICFSGGNRVARDVSTSLRRIIWRGQLKAEETYYLRIQQLLEDNMQTYLDYLEWCPKSVYANPNEPEDIW